MGAPFRTSACSTAADSYGEGLVWQCQCCGAVIHSKFMTIGSCVSCVRILKWNCSIIKQQASTQRLNEKDQGFRDLIFMRSDSLACPASSCNGKIW